MIVSWCSVKGSPGVSSWSVLTAGKWPAESPFEIAVLEADPAGGVMATRYGLGVSPGAVDLGVVAQRSPDQLDLSRIGRRVGERAWLVPGPIVAAEASAAWRHSVEQTASLLAADNRVWFVDIGRFRPEFWPWLEASVLSIVVTWGHVDALVCAAPTIAELLATSPVKALIVGQPDHPIEEVGAFLGCPVIQVGGRQVVDDSRTVWENTSRWRRGGRWSEASDLAWSLHETTALVDAP